MSIFSMFSNQPSLLWKFMGFFQRPSIRILHALLTILIIVNLLLGYNLCSIKDSASFCSSLLWVHISVGITITLLTILFIPLCLFYKGLKHFYPYLWGKPTQLMKDIKASLSFKLIPPTSGGLAAVVQGLGLGALLLTILAGIIWFIGWQTSGSYAHFFKDIHEVGATLLGIYLLGHGTMAFIHFFVWQKKVMHKTTNNTNTNHTYTL